MVGASRRRARDARERQSGAAAMAAATEGPAPIRRVTDSIDISPPSFTKQAGSLEQRAHESRFAARA